MLRGSLKSANYILNHQQESVDFIAKTWSLSPEDALGSYKTISQGLTPNGLASTEALQADLGEDATAADVDKVTDFRLLRQILADLNIKA